MVFKGERAGDRGRGHGTLLLVDFKGKNPEHAMHPQGGGGFIPFGVRAAAASAILLPKNKEVLLANIVMEHITFVLHHFERVYTDMNPGS